MLSLLEHFELSQTPMPPFLCPPSSHFLDHLCPTSLSPFLIRFQNTHAHPPPNPTFLYFCPSSHLGEGNHFGTPESPCSGFHPAPACTTWQLPVCKLL